MLTIAQLLTAKGTLVLSISPDHTVLDALRLMAEHNVGALLIVEDGLPVGMLSERDYARKVVLAGRASVDTPVRRIMSTGIVHVTPGDTVEHAMTLMTRSRVRHLPVLDQGRVAGLVSIGDLVKATIDQQQFVIERLEDYIRT
ncbi:MAG: CBS domain-containing protein [Vicinamibacterales bacterium]